MITLMSRYAKVLTKGWTELDDPLRETLWEGMNGQTGCFLVSGSPCMIDLFTFVCMLVTQHLLRWY